MLFCVLFSSNRVRTRLEALLCERAIGSGDATIFERIAVRLTLNYCSNRMRRTDAATRSFACTYFFEVISMKSG